MADHVAANNDRMARFCDDWFVFANAHCVSYSVAEVRNRLIETRNANAHLLREYLIEKSGRWIDQGASKEYADHAAARIAADKFGADFNMCLGILKAI